MSKLLDGTKVAEKIYVDIAKKVAMMKIKPILAVILVGNDPASHLYVSIKEKKCQEVGIGIQIFCFTKNVQTVEIVEIVNKLNRDKKINGIIIQLPLPKGLDTNKIIETINPKKDVDGLNPENLGKLLTSDQTAIIPPTALGILKLLKYYQINLSGKHVVMVGYGKLVGKPLAAMIALEEKNATLTICNSKTKNLAFYTRQADILISATGVPHLIKLNMVKKGAIVIDAGTTIIRPKTKDQRPKIVGDIDFENVKKIASYITPPRGGVGPMTVVMLLDNLINLRRNS